MGTTGDVLMVPYIIKGSTPRENSRGKVDWPWILTEIKTDLKLYKCDKSAPGIPAIKSILNTYFLPDDMQLEENEVFSWDLFLALKALAICRGIKNPFEKQSYPYHLTEKLVDEIDRLARQKPDKTIFEKNELYKKIKNSGLENGMAQYIKDKKVKSKKKIAKKKTKFYNTAKACRNITSATKTRLEQAAAKYHFDQNKLMERVGKMSQEYNYSIEEFLSALMEASELYPNVNPYLLSSVIKIESEGNPNALSRGNAKGLTQMTWIAAKDVGYSAEYETGAILDIRTNILAGAKYLSKMLKKFPGDIKIALAAYNSGPTYVKKHAKDAGKYPLPRETINYVARVINNYKG